MGPQMLLGISPQCLYHNIPMILIEQTARLDGHSLCILNLRKVDCKNPVLHECTDR